MYPTNCVYGYEVYYFLIVRPSITFWVLLLIVQHNLSENNYYLAWDI